MTEPKIISLIDGSVYAESVCDHTAWIAERGARRLSCCTSSGAGKPHDRTYPVPSP